MRRFVMFVVMVLLLAAPPVSFGADRIKVFIDQDTSGPGGTDSVSIAMLLLAPNIEVVGIGVVAGDAWLDQAMYHTLKIVELCGQSQVPVAAGSEEPLLNSQQSMEMREALWGIKSGDGWHGAWGKDQPKRGEITPAPGGPPTIKPVNKHAAELLIEMARKYPGELVLYTAGPLTNVALAIRLAPDIVGKIKAVYTMGGHIEVNQRFNFWWDAEAAAIHLRAPWKVKHLSPIDIGEKTRLTRAMVEQIATAPTPLAQYMKETYLGQKSEPWMFGYMWDELAAASIIDPAVITKNLDLYVDCDFAWNSAYGKLLWWKVNEKPWFADSTWHVQTELDWPRFEKLYVELLRKPPANSK